MRSNHFFLQPLSMACVLLVSLSTLSAQDNPAHLAIQDLATAPKAEIVFESTTFDFGTIRSGEIVQHVFNFTNTGSVPLVLVNAKGSCGCTVPQWPREPILPGETASLVAEFNSTGRSGKQTKRITITANTDPATQFLTISATVEAADAAGQPAIASEEISPEKNPDCFAIYPNPTSEVVTLQVDEEHQGKTIIASIHSQGGQLMARREIDEVGSTITFEVGHYPAGSYIATVQIDQGIPDTRCFVVVK